MNQLEFLNAEPVAIKKKEWNELLGQLPFANIEQLRNWYEIGNGKEVIEACVQAKNYKKTWKEYATKYNAENSKANWWILQTSVDGIIHAFGVRKYNVFNFQKLLTEGAIEDRTENFEKNTGKATKERLLNWYRKYGNNIIEICKSSDDPLSTWKILSEKFNNEFALSQGWFLPTTINGIIYVFWSKFCSFFNATKLLSGKEMTEEEMLSSKRKFRANKNQLIKWYNNGGREIVQSCRESGDFAVAWRNYADQFNKTSFYECWFQIQNNKVGLVTALGGSNYTIQEIVRLLEGWPEWTIVPEVSKNNGTWEKRKKQHLQWYREWWKEVIEHCRRSVNIRKAWGEYSTAFNKEQENTNELKLQTTIKGLVDVLGWTGSSIEEVVRLFEWLPSGTKIPSIKENTAAILKEETHKLEQTNERYLENDEKWLSTWMLEFSHRFPNFFNIHRKYYLPFRIFIQLLEKSHPGESEINDAYIKIEIKTGWKLLLTVTKKYIYEHNSSLILDLFHKAQESYNTLCERNNKLPFIEMDLHIEVQ